MQKKTLNMIYGLALSIKDVDITNDSPFLDNMGLCVSLVKYNRYLDI